MRRLFHFVLPATLTLGLAGLAVYLAYLTPAYFAAVAQDPGASRTAIFTMILPLPQTALMTFSILCGLLLVVFVEPPSEAWAGGAVPSGDKRPALLAGVLALAYAALFALPSARHLFELAPLSPLDCLALVLAAAVWALLLRWIWRTRLFERLFDIDFGRPSEPKPR